jgi:hypothetical protein
MQIEQTQMHVEQPQIRFETKREILMLFEPLLKKFKCLLKIKGRLQQFLISGVSCPYQDL